MKRVAALLLMAFLAACSEPPPSTVITVSEFLADESLRADHVGRCRENPGALGQTPICRNAEEAEGKARLERMNRALGG
ncbi:EexN family lipoprotein [Brucella grignonensis]|uniref:EexN family lipoprotein n=1 Tax=Brucella grignonensis TaxID=94627 RepID=UPI000B981B00|nr:EexN family lipoprotein [Brucella grignonensis]NKB84810.1 EexN family lipoprotein [Brucella grignonensis]